jgi:hypothetical protein
MACAGNSGANVKSDPADGFSKLLCTTWQLRHCCQHMKCNNVHRGRSTSIAWNIFIGCALSLQALTNNLTSLGLGLLVFILLMTLHGVAGSPGLTAAAIAHQLQLNTQPGFTGVTDWLDILVTLGTLQRTGS